MIAKNFKLKKFAPCPFFVPGYKNQVQKFDGYCTKIYNKIVFFLHNKIYNKIVFFYIIIVKKIFNY